MHSPIHLFFEADLKNLATIRSSVEDAARRINGSPEVVTDIMIAVNEAVTNIIVHGYKKQPKIIEIELDKDEDRILVYIHDQAPRFDPTSVPAPNLASPLENRSLGGMGIPMMRRLTDEMVYRYTL
jgi:serine/threonine-protein kinase RsbW